MMLTGDLNLKWELPSRFVEQDIKGWVLASGAATLKGGMVHFARCEHQVANLYGSVGSLILKGAISALKSSNGIYSLLSHLNYLLALYLSHMNAQKIWSLR